MLKDQCNDCVCFSECPDCMKERGDTYKAFEKNSAPASGQVYTWD